MTISPTFQSITTTIVALGVAWFALMGANFLDGKKSESSFRYVSAYAVAHPVWALAVVCMFYLAVVFFVQWREKVRADVQKISALSTGLGLFETHRIITARERVNALKRDYQNDRQYLLQFWQSFENVYGELPYEIQQASQARRAFGVGQPTQLAIVSWPGQVHKALIVLHDATKPNYEVTELALPGAPTADLLHAISPTIDFSNLESLAHRLRSTTGSLTNIGIGGATYFGGQNATSKDAAKWCCFILPQDLRNFHYVEFLKNIFGFGI